MSSSFFFHNRNHSPALGTCHKPRLPGTVGPIVGEYGAQGPEKVTVEAEVPVALYHLWDEWKYLSKASVADAPFVVVAERELPLVLQRLGCAVGLTLGEWCFWRWW